MKKPFSKFSTTVQQVLPSSILISGVLLTLLPFWTMLVLAFSPFDLSHPLQLVPTSWTHKNFQFILNVLPILTYVGNSFAIAILSTAGAIYINATAGYALARLPFKHKPLWEGLVWLTLMIPPQVNIVPLFILMKQWHLLNTHWGIILPSCVSGVMVVLYQQWFAQQSVGLEESAQLEGASTWQCFWQISFPLARSLTVSVGLLSFIGAWNGFLWPLIVLQDDTLKTLPLALALLKEGFRDATNWPVLMAAGCLSVLPIILLYILGQKLLINGIAQGGIKE
jgi:ABC-type glycerol-3-phosphate transport system permease component